MDARFTTACELMLAGDVLRFRELLEADPELATIRSETSHPTLMQCLALDGVALPAEALAGMAASLFEAGSVLDEALIASGSLGNLVLAEWLLDRGAHADGSAEVLRGWTALEESLYWGESAFAARMVERGASIGNLRTAAGLGRGDETQRFFDSSGALRMPQAGVVNWPFVEQPPEQQSSQTRDVLDNALVYAALSGEIAVVDLLREHGAQLNVIPLGFHYRGSALHWAAMRGHGEMCMQLIERGADRTLEDETQGVTPAEWARVAGRPDLARKLQPSD